MVESDILNQRQSNCLRQSSLNLAAEDWVLIVGIPISKMNTLQNYQIQVSMDIRDTRVLAFGLIQQISWSIYFCPIAFIHKFLQNY